MEGGLRIHTAPGMPATVTDPNLTAGHWYFLQWQFRGSGQKMGSYQIFFSRRAGTALIGLSRCESPVRPV